MNENVNMLYSVHVIIWINIPQWRASTYLAKRKKERKKVVYRCMRERGRWGCLDVCMCGGGESCPGCMRQWVCAWRDWMRIVIILMPIIYEPVTKGRDLKWDTLPQNQTPSKLFSVLPLDSGMFQLIQVTISIIKKWFWSKCVLCGIKTGVRSGVDVCNTNNGHSECHNNTEKNHLYAILMLLVHLSSC